jgi:glycosyltransferase involved in cell wall biosynthesis
MRKCLVVSAVNIIEGGTLTVLRDCLLSASQYFPLDWEIIALVHDKKLINNARVRVIELPKAKQSWFIRLYYEWVYFKRLSRELKPDLWLSLHDITPRVHARRQAVYCHNPSPFYRLPWREARLEPKLWLFNCFYHYLYGVFISRNALVIVQQGWLRQKFRHMFGPLPIVVAHPTVNSVTTIPFLAPSIGPKVFLYPSLPRVFKNFEVICEAAKILSGRGIGSFEIRITLSGSENRYSKWLYAKYSAVQGLCFIGLQSREQMVMQYRESGMVIFASKLETWGLPISEAKMYKKPLLVADLPYAHETVGTYEQVSFFPATDADALADLMQSFIEGRWKSNGAEVLEPGPPFARDWVALWRLLAAGL